MPPHQRNPVRLDKYLEIHSQHIEHLDKAGYVLAKSLPVEKMRHEFLMNGIIHCPGEIVISVKKRLAIRGYDGSMPIVISTKYEYNISIKGIHNLFRYDNTHPGNAGYPGHADPFHKHTFDIETGEERGKSPIWIGYHNWPTLYEVVNEANHLYHENKELIDEILHRNKSGFQIVG